jgi:cobalt/nickel transport system ATP-binding protein
VLDGVTFEISRGEKVVLLGANGSGKTTLLRILDGLLFPDRGRYRFAGKPVTREGLSERDFCRWFRKSVGFLFQNPDAMLFSPSVAEEIAFGPMQFGLDARVSHWAEVFALGPLLQKVPTGLSGGEKQKVCLAALLAVEPEVLLLDEPTANLDPRSTGWLVDFLQELPITTLVTTHNLSLARELGERTLLLSEGHRLIYDGPLDALLDDREKLLQANLVHTHRHRHQGLEHRHYHSHDWD